MVVKSWNKAIIALIREAGESKSIHLLELQHPVGIEPNCMIRSGMWSKDDDGRSRRGVGTKKSSELRWRKGSAGPAKLFAPLHNKQLLVLQLDERFIVSLVFYRVR